jgi:hypothetical protein
VSTQIETNPPRREHRGGGSARVVGGTGNIVDLAAEGKREAS